MRFVDILKKIKFVLYYIFFFRILLSNSYHFHIYFWTVRGRFLSRQNIKYRIWNWWSVNVYFFCSKRRYNLDLEDKSFQFIEINFETHQARWPVSSSCLIFIIIILFFSIDTWCLSCSITKTFYRSSERWGKKTTTLGSIETICMKKLAIRVRNQRPFASFFKFFLLLFFYIYIFSETRSFLHSMSFFFSYALCETLGNVFILVITDLLDLIEYSVISGLDGLWKVSRFHKPLFLFFPCRILALAIFLLSFETIYIGKRFSHFGFF